MTKKKQKQVSTAVLIIAIAALVFLETAAMHYGVNGKLFAVVIAAISGIAGWTLPQLKLK